MSKIPRKHHYIPQFYLRAWTGYDGRLLRYDNPFGSKITAKRVFTSQVGFEERLYSARNFADTDPEWLETEFFQKIDDGASKALRKLSQTPPLPLSDIEESMWSVFIRSLYHRSPSLLNKYLEEGVRYWIEETPNIVDSALREREFAIDQETREILISNTMNNVEDSVLDNLPSVLMSPRVGQFLNDLKKTIIDIPETCYDFLLSDALPVRTDGLMTEVGHYVIPINPRRLLVAAFSEGTLQAIKALPANELVKRTNHQVVGYARHFVAARDESQDRFIRNRFGKLIK